MPQASPSSEKPKNLTRTRTGCDACRRRKKKCDEGKPECAACLRLRISCVVTKPSFEFVPGNTSMFREHLHGRSRQRANSRHSRLRNGHILIDDKTRGRDLTSSRTPTFIDDLDSSTRLRDVTADGQEDCTQLQTSLTNVSKDVLIHGGHERGVPTQFCASDSINLPYPQLRTVLPESSSHPAIAPSILEQRYPILIRTYDPSSTPRSSIYHNASASPTTGSSEFLGRSRHISATATQYQPLGKPPDAGQLSVTSLGAWFSSFVDLIPPPGSPVHVSPANWEARERAKGEEFAKLQENLYLNYWRSHVLGTIPAPFGYVEGLVKGFPALRLSIIALSACKLAQAQIEVRSRTMELQEQWFYGPSREHQERGRMYYERAVRELANMDYDGQDKVSILATLIFFALVESLIGSFRAVAFHHHSIEHLLSDYHRLCKNSMVGRGLISVWMALRSQNWSCRIPFTLLDFQSSLSEVGVGIYSELDPLETRNEVVVINLLQSWRLSLMTLFERYAGRGDMETISARCCRDAHQRVYGSRLVQPWIPKEPIEDEDYDSLLGDQRRILDEWYTTLPQSHRPVESFWLKSDAHNLFQSNVASASNCYLSFQSPQAAMNYAYYVVARIVQSEQVMHDFVSLTITHEPIHPETTQWLLVLLRIIGGLNIIASTKQEFYGVGLLDMIKMCLLRLPRCNSIICSLADYLFAQFSSHCITNDGYGLVSDFKSDFEEIEIQRARGRDLFYIMPRGSPDTIRQSDVHLSTAHAMVYGRDRATGRLFCE